MAGETSASTGGVGDRLAGTTILLTGVSGFVGKAVLDALLEYAPRLGRLIVLVRAADDAAAARRLEEEVLGADAFANVPLDRRVAPLRDERLRAVAIDLDHLGDELPSGTDWTAVDTVIHCAASVSFEDPLDEILTLNARGPARLLGALRRSGARPRFVHVSTAYAADCRHDRVYEEGTEHPGLAALDPDAMEVAAAEWREAAEAESRTGAVRGELLREARRDAAHRPGMDAEERAERLRARWVRERLGERGRLQAVEAGWPDTYALTKALGERLLKECGGTTTIVRPSIIESALRRPFPGWLEGIKVADPLILAYASRGLTDLPGRASNPIDIVPVDLVANACVAAAAHPPAEGEGPRTISVASSARNPLAIGALAGHIKAHFSREPLRKRDGSPIRIGDLRFVDREVALRRTRRRERLARTAERLARLTPGATGLERGMRRNSALAGQVTRMVGIYGPYTELSCVFDDSNARRLAESMTPVDRVALCFDAADFDWTGYLEGIHLPAVHRMFDEGQQPKAAAAS